MAISLGVNTWVWVSPFKTADTNLFPKIKRMGFDTVELAMEDPSLVNARIVAAALRDAGLSATMVGAFGPSRDMSHEDRRVQQEALDYIRTCVNMCEQMGIRIFAGPLYSAVGKARLLPPEERARERDRSISNLKKAAAMAFDYGVTLGLEPLNRFETDMVNTHQQALAMVRAVGSRSLQVHLDTFHMNIEEKDTEAAVKACKGRLCHVHASESDRGTPGTGQVDWQGLARGLKSIRYNGSVVIETFTPAVKEIAKAAAIWRPLAQSQDVLARDGFKFLRKTLH